MKKITRFFAFFVLLVSTVAYAQDIHFTFANAETTNDGTNDFFEVDVMMQTINTTGTFKLGSGQLYFNYNIAAFGSNVFANSKVEFSYPDGEGYICAQGVDAAAGAKIYGSFTVNDNTTSRVSWAFSQIFSASTFAADNVIETPTKLCHLKLEFIDNGQLPMLMFESGTIYDDQFYTACGPITANPFETANCGAEAGMQLLSDTFDSGGALLSVDKSNLVTNYKIYPNPTNGIINIEGDLTKITSVDVYSILGQQLMTVKSNFNRLNLTELQSSILFIKLNTEYGSKVVKIIKN